jgi:SAM-dependent methyltransferase
VASSLFRKKRALDQLGGIGRLAMNSATYTPGHSQNALDFMAQRTLASHGQFFEPYLAPDLSVLDCGCGPGTITLGIAECVSPGRVVGVDRGRSEIERAVAIAEKAGVTNVEYQTADCYALPFSKASFDRVFSHALLEHLASPTEALREFGRVLKPGGIVGVCSPDWGGFLLAPPSPSLSRAVEAYMDLQIRNGGDVLAGRKLGLHLADAGFSEILLSARYETYGSPKVIAEYLAPQLERDGHEEEGQTLRRWSMSEGCFFAQAWVSGVAKGRS